MLVSEVCIVKVNQNYQTIRLTYQNILTAKKNLARLCNIVESKRVLIATDVPFWRASTGAEQRIRSLIACLTKQTLQLKLFFLATHDAVKIRQEIESCQELDSSNLSIEVHASSDPPKQLSARLGWHMAGIKNLLTSKQTQPDGLDGPPLRLDDFNWPWARAKFAETVSQFQPDSIIIEYVKLAYLLDDLNPNQSSQIQTIIDSHDMLHKRYRDFQARGERHWIAIDENEEAAVLNRFDTVIAIQPLEAEAMASMAPSAKVIVCKHACFPEGPHPNVANFQQTEADRILSFGILASNNPANRSAIDSFIKNIWLPLYANAAHIQLTIAGSVCASFKPQQIDAKNIRWAPELDSAARFYGSVDVVVNPIEFGSGLKIKNVEAIAHGKPLITTSHGAHGFVESPQASVLVADEPKQWQAAIDRLSDPDEIACTGKLAAQLSAKQFSNAAVYGPLLELIL